MLRPLCTLALAGVLLPSMRLVADDSSGRGTVPSVPVTMANAADVGCQRPVNVGRISVTPGGEAEPGLTDMLRRLVDEAAAQIVAASGFPAPSEEVAPPSEDEITRIADVLADCEYLNQKRVVLSGEFAGTIPGALSPLANVQRVDGMDLILRDATGEIFFSALPKPEKPQYPWDPVPPPPPTDPENDLGKRIIVVGEVRISSTHQPYILARGAFRRVGERGAFCGLETMAPDPEHEGALPVRLIFCNDTAEPITLMYPAGVTHDIIVTSDGREVWRLSRTQRPGPGEVTPRQEIVPPLDANEEPRQEFIPGNAWRVYVDYWGFVDDNGDRVQPGPYQVQGVISRRIYTMPLTIQVP